MNSFSMKHTSSCDHCKLEFVSGDDDEHTSTTLTIIRMLKAIKTKDHDSLYLVQVFEDFRCIHLFEN